MRLINGDALYDAYDSALWDCNHDSDMAQDLLIDAPTIDAVPVVHGEWIDDGVEYARCSECRESYDCEEEGFDLFSRFYNYCPNCGAKMEKPIRK